MNPAHYDIAYSKLVDYLLHFCMSRVYGTSETTSQTPRTFGGSAGFCSLDIPGQCELQPGDLVLLSAANSPKFRLSWFIESRIPEGGVDREYALRSAQGDGEECWWSNVGVSYFHRPTLAHHPEWAWTNEQHEFNSMWLKACYEDNDAYMIVPMQVCFSGDKVELRTRMRHSLDEYKPIIHLENFRDVTRLELGDHYQQLEKMHNAHRDAQKKLREEKEVIP